METRRLHLLLELSRLGSMRAVAEAHNLTTSTVSQQLAALTAETGTALIEPEGRRVRLTPAGQRLADHAVTILAAVDAARLDLDPTAEPEGTLRVGGFATAVRTAMLPVALSLQHSHPQVDVVICEYEPAEAFALIERDDLDLALTYDYNLAPASQARYSKHYRSGRRRGDYAFPTTPTHPTSPRNPGSISAPSQTHHG